MVVFGSKSSSAKTKLFEQPLDKLFDPKAIRHFNETIAASNSRSPPALCQSLSVPLTSSTLTWAKLSQDNSATKRKRAAARLRRFTIDANNNTSSLIQSITATPIANPVTASLCISYPHHRPLESSSHSSPTLVSIANMNTSSIRDEHQLRNNTEGELNESDRCRMLLNVLPEPIKCLLNEIYLRGPSTVGIFRKSPSAKHCKELKQKLESPDFQLSAIEQYQVNVIASVFKEWLRSLPDCLLMSRLYPQWIDVAKLIEPLYLHLQQQQSTTDHSLSQGCLNSSSSSKDNLSGNLSKSPNGDSAVDTTSLRTAASPESPLTDNSQQHRPESSGNLSPDNVNAREQLSRALSCSIMTSDSGHSSTSSSPSSSPSSPFDSGRSEAAVASSASEARARRQHFQKANSEIQSQHGQQQLFNQSTSYLKKKCYQHRQQQQLQPSQYSIDREADAHNIGRLISNLDGEASTYRSGEATNQQLSEEFSLRERRFECIRVVRQLLEALNETNLILLRATICVLWHIAANSDYNKMSSSNLGVCIGQSLLNDEQCQPQNRGKKLQPFSLSISSSPPFSQTNVQDAKSNPITGSNFIKRHRRARSQCLLASTLSLTNLSHLSTGYSPTHSTGTHGHLTSSISSNYLDSSGAQETAKFVPILVAFMIDNARELFGSDVMNLFGPRRPLSPTECDQESLRASPNEAPHEGSNEPTPLTDRTNLVTDEQTTDSLPEPCSNVGQGKERQQPSFVASPAIRPKSVALNPHQLVNTYRMPKIPFQYTTSCYGGQAVIFYPSDAYLSQQQPRQPRQQPQDMREDFIDAKQQQQQKRGCNRIQSLDRLTHSNHLSSHMQPQRSHVMMLRDYYLSLQEQNQSQQHYREFLKRQQHQCKQQMVNTSQRPAVANVATINNHFQLIQQQQQPQQQRQDEQQQQQHQPQRVYRQPQAIVAPPSVGPRQQHQHLIITVNPNVRHANDSTRMSRNGNHELMIGQPASAAVAHQRIQPRLARIRPNQFNGLYVKRATSPMHNLDGTTLIKLDHHHDHQQHHRHQTSSGTGGVCKPLVQSKSPSNLAAISQSSLSQQSSKMSSSSAEHSSDEELCSSDECSTESWMESTMV